MKENYCNDCRYMYTMHPGNGENTNIKHCRRLPPHTIINSFDEMGSVFPAVSEHMNCGEFSPKSNS